MSEPKDPGFDSFFDNVIQPDRAWDEIKPPKRIFQSFKYEVINMPRIWSPDDDARSKREGWGIGNLLLIRGRREDMIPDWVGIGKRDGTFVTDEDAHDWVAEQAMIEGDPDKFIYKRALAVVAALHIRMKAEGSFQLKDASGVNSYNIYSD